MRQRRRATGFRAADFHCDYGLAGAARGDAGGAKTLRFADRLNKTGDDGGVRILCEILNVIGGVEPGFVAHGQCEARLNAAICQ